MSDFEFPPAANDDLDSGTAEGAAGFAEDSAETETNYEEVFETSEPDVLPVIKSALDAAGIPWATDGEALMNLFPSEAMSSVTVSDGAEVRIFVPESRAEEARALLTQDFQLAEPTPELDGSGE